MHDPADYVNGHDPLEYAYLRNPLDYAHGHNLRHYGYGNKYWPAFYLIDKKGQVRSVFFGETHEGDQQAKRIEKKINELLAE